MAAQSSRLSQDTKMLKFFLDQKDQTESEPTRMSLQKDVENPKPKLEAKKVTYQLVDVTLDPKSICPLNLQVLSQSPNSTRLQNIRKSMPLGIPNYRESEDVSWHVRRRMKIRSNQ